MGFADTFIGLDPNSAEWVQYFANTLYVLGILVWTLLGVAAVFAAWYFLAFKIPVHIYERIGDSNVLRFINKTRCRVYTKDNVEKLQIFFMKGTFSAPKIQDYFLGRKGKMLNLLKIGDDFRPFQMKAGEGNIVVQDQDVRFWSSQKMGEIAKKYTEQSFMQKYGAYMTFIFGMLILGWMFYVQLKFINGNLQDTIGQTNRIIELLQSNAP